MHNIFLVKYFEQLNKKEVTNHRSWGNDHSPNIDSIEREVTTAVTAMIETVQVSKGATSAGQSRAENDFDKVYPVSSNYKSL